MNNLVNTLLRASITASMSNREAFIERVAKIIEEKVGSNPESAQAIGDNIASAMDGLNDYLLVDQLLKPQRESSSLMEQKMDKLIESIDRLNANVEKLCNKK